MPPSLHDTVKKSLYRSFRRDFNTITEEYDLYEKLTPSMQNELISYLFSDVKRIFSDVFDGCEQAFINQVICGMAYNCFEQGQVI